MWLTRGMWEKIAHHIEVTNGELGQLDKRVQGLERDLPTMRNDLDWVKKLQWVLVAGTLGSNTLALLKLFGVI